MTWNCPYLSLGAIMCLLCASVIMPLPTASTFIMDKPIISGCSFGNLPGSSMFSHLFCTNRSVTPSIFLTWCSPVLFTGCIAPVDPFYCFLTIRGQFITCKNQPTINSLMNEHNELVGLESIF